MTSRGLLLFTVLGLGACLDEQTTRCSDGSICAGDLACAPAGGCVDPTLLGQCEVTDEGRACDYLQDAEGVCHAGLCVAAGCGNAVVEPARGEACDDGNAVDGDGCNATCSSTGACGNGQVDPGEACDCGDGTGALPAGCPTPNGDTVDAACSLTCTALRCGNAVVDPREACDDGNLVDGDGCSADCRSDETCGNGVRDLGEGCDDGNLVDGDGCQATCTLPDCGDGVRDAGETCDDGNLIDGDGCAANCASDETCGNGVRDLGEECDDGNLVDGDSCQATCLRPACGDAVVDAGEACDDGNLVDADGCASNCKSTETCGNGVPDFLVAEQCDDGNLQSQDGCSSGCRVETWRLRTATPGLLPAPTDASTSMVYDAARAATVLVLSNAQDVLETWTFDGVAWRREAPAESPTPRYAPGLAYDEVNGQVVLFGGGNGERDTWLWDGITWTQQLIAPASAPPNLGYTFMTYDSVRHQTLLFVGGTWGDVAQLWAWDGAAWSRLATGGPPGSYPDAFVFDPKRGVAVLHGGYGLGGAGQRTWEWNGSAWAERTVAGGPAADYTDPAYFDTTIGEVVLARTWPTTKLWAWNGVRWQQRPAAAAPGIVLDALAHDWRRGWTVATPSFTGATTTPSTWQYTGATWTPFAPVQPDFSFGAVGLIAEPWTASTLAVSAYGTYRWTGRGWQVVTSGPSMLGYDIALAADEARQAIVALGDAGALYRLTGGGWVEDVPGNYALPIGSGGALAYDAARDELIMIGGTQTDGTTWRQVGSTWEAAASPALSPPPRFRAALGYDPVHARVVLFGGLALNGTTKYADTWAWDGTTWTELSPAHVPGGRAGAALFYDAQAGALTMAGGTGDIDAPVWRWDGTDWSPEIFAGASAIVGMPAAAAPRQRGLIFAGYDWATSTSVVRALRLEAGDAEEACLGADLDGDHDGLPGCDDLDCRARCAPTCVGDDCSAATPRCGDGTCGAAEDCAICPDDCGTCAAVCGNAWCEDGEVCPGDCGP